MTGYVTEVTIGGTSYPTIAAAADAVGYTRQWLCMKIRRGDTSVCGMPMSYNDTMKNHRGKMVECVETGEIFPTATAASYSIGRGRTIVANGILYGRTVGGYHWRYLE